MQLLVIRHAIAEDKSEFAATGRPDGERPLTKRGQKEMRRVAAEYGDTFIETVSALEPGRSMMSFAKWLGTVKRARVVEVVGHEPHLSTLVTWLMSGVNESHLTLEKGGVCLLELDRKAAPQSATLRWSLTPDVLRKLSRR